MNIPFVKMTGAGNDFVLIDEREPSYGCDWPAITSKLCNRRYGIGADGLLILRKSTSADFMMMYYNADGSYGGMCGNGGRCSAAYVMSCSGAVTVSFEALGHVYAAGRDDRLIRLKMKPVPPIGRKTRLHVTGPDLELPVRFVDTGAPHAVIILDEISPMLRDAVGSEFVRIGTAVAHHEQFAPDGTNVDFIGINPDKSVSMRTFERGVEAETLACGTGAVASAIVAGDVTGLKTPVTIITRSNERLIVDYRPSGQGHEDVWLTGPAVEVFSGSITI